MKQGTVSSDLSHIGLQLIIIFIFAFACVDSIFVALWLKLLICGTLLCRKLLGDESNDEESVRHEVDPSESANHFVRYFNWVSNGSSTEQS